MAYYSKESDSLYIHIPKAYGTSIAATLELAGFKHLCVEWIADYRALPWDMGTLELIQACPEYRELTLRYFEFFCFLVFSFWQKNTGRRKLLFFLL